MRRFAGFLAGVVLLPFCAAMVMTFFSMLRMLHHGPLTSIPLAVWGLLGGFSLWVLVYALLPRPVWSYVLAHELTHALCGMLMGARVKRMKVSEAGGSVTLSKTNFLITLAPYIFPFYAILVALLYLVLGWFYPAVKTYEWLWFSAIGFTWGFHLTFTASTLMGEQSDIRMYGAFISYVFILLMNTLGLCLLVAAVSPLRLFDLADLLIAHTATAYRLAGHWVVVFFRWIYDAFAK
jgi:hypothetical protein